MTDGTAPPLRRWRFRLQLLAGLALLVLAVMALRAQRERAEVATRREAVRGALVRLVEAQEEHYARTGRYSLHLDSSLAWRAPPSVTVRFAAEDDQSWRAVATDSALVIPPTTCGVFLGRQSSAPHRAVVASGQVACW